MGDSIRGALFCGKCREENAAASKKSPRLTPERGQAELNLALRL